MNPLSQTLTFALFAGAVCGAAFGASFSAYLLEQAANRIAELEEALDAERSRRAGLEAFNITRWLREADTLRDGETAQIAALTPSTTIDGTAAQEEDDLYHAPGRARLNVLSSNDPSGGMNYAPHL